MTLDERQRRTPRWEGPRHRAWSWGNLILRASHGYGAAKLIKDSILRWRRMRRRHRVSCDTCRMYSKQALTH